MAELSKFYKVTNQIMIEYIADLYMAHETASTINTTYAVYTGKDNKSYYTEKPHSNDHLYSNTLYFIKFPDSSDSEYTYLGLQKIDNDIYDNSELLNNLLSDVVNNYKESNGNMHYDKIRIHMIYGFTMDKLAGITLKVKTNARYLGPVLKYHPNSTTHKLFDDDGNPVFETENITVEENGQLVTCNAERLVNNMSEFTLLDIFFPRECLSLNNVVQWHRVPLYQNGCFYDRYIEFDVPSAYFLSVDALTNNMLLTTPNMYGYDQNNLYVINNGDIKSYYAKPAVDINDRSITYLIIKDPTIIIDFATVSEENLTTNIFSDVLYNSTFFLDPINLISLKYKSNSDYFNVRIYEDLDNNEIVYYPVYGEGENAVELNYNIFNLIESGEIPLISEGFYDGLDNMKDFYDMYGENAYKWIIYNEMTVTYIYSKYQSPLESQNSLNEILHTINFTNIIDYGIPNPEESGDFWKSTFIPKVPERNNLYCNSILIQYTCRLVNRLTSVEAIRTATLTVKEPTRYISKRITINNVVTYKIVNLIKKNEGSVLTIHKEYKDKLVRSYYDATNLVIKDMGDGNMYTLGLMTLNLKHSSTNYVLRLFNLNDDNIRIPYDLTGPYKYLLVFPSADGNKIKIKPNSDSTALNLGIGLLVFYITEEQVKKIMQVPVNNRYFAIVTDTNENDTMLSTLYEGKVAYYG